MMWASRKQSWGKQNKTCAKQDLSLTTMRDATAHQDFGSSAARNRHTMQTVNQTYKSSLCEVDCRLSALQYRSWGSIAICVVRGLIISYEQKEQLYKKYAWGQASVSTPHCQGLWSGHTIHSAHVVHRNIGAGMHMLTVLLFSNFPHSSRVRENCLNHDQIVKQWLSRVGRWCSCGDQHQAKSISCSFGSWSMKWRLIC